jgi:hypothetical protein
VKKMLTNFGIIHRYIYILLMLLNYENYVRKRMITLGPGLVKD